MNDPETRRLVVTFDLEYDPDKWPDIDTPSLTGDHLLPNIACFVDIVCNPNQGDDDAGYQLSNPTVWTMRGFFDDIIDRIPE